jgi:hypothetical protein
MRVRTIGKWTLASGLVGIFALGGVNHRKSAAALAQAGKPVPEAYQPQYYVPCLLAMAAAVVGVAAL